MGKLRWAGAETGHFSSMCVCVYIYIYVSTINVLKITTYKKILLVEAVLTLVDGTVSDHTITEAGTYSCPPVKQCPSLCVYITHHSHSHRMLIPITTLLSNPNSDYRYVILFYGSLPVGYCGYSFQLQPFGILEKRKWKVKAEGGDLHFKPARFKVWFRQVASAPGKLLEMQIWGSNPSLLEPASSGRSPGRKPCFIQLCRCCLCLLTFEKCGSKALLAVLQNSLWHCLGENWGSGVHRGGFSLFTPFYTIWLFFSHTHVLLFQ